MKLKDLLFEIGGGSGDTYDLKKEYERWMENGFAINYIFRTLEHRYIIVFDGRKKHKKYGDKSKPVYSVEVRFSPDGEEVDELTGEGNAVKVINTVVEATKRVANEYGDVITRFKLQGIPKAGEDVGGTEATQRSRVYEKFYERAFGEDKVRRKGRTVYIRI